MIDETSAPQILCARMFWMTHPLKMICHWEVVVLSTNEEKSKCQYWKFSYYLNKKGCLQLKWRSMMASLFLNKFLCRKEAKSICIYSIIWVFFFFFPKYASQNSNAYFMAQQPPFRRGSLLLELLGGVFAKTLIRLFPISPSPIPQSCIWLYYLSSLELLQTPSLWGSSDCYQL